MTTVWVKEEFHGRNLAMWTTDDRNRKKKSEIEGGQSMNRRLWRRGMALTLAAAMTAGLAACSGESGSTASKGKQHYFKATYLSDLPENFNDNVNKVTFKGDVMYYGGYDDNYDS